MKRTIFVIGALAGVLAASTASAALVKVTLTGTHENVNDATGVFGAPGGRITDLPFVEIFTIDTAGGNVVSTPTLVSFDDIFGAGPPYAVGASLTIGGSAPFTTLGETYSGVSAGATDYQISSNDQPTPAGGGSSNLNFALDLSGSGLPATVTAPFSAAIDGLQYTAFDSFIDGVTDTFGNAVVDAQGTLDPSTITISDVSAAPEPSSWALLVAGVGLIGAVLQRRARAVAAWAGPSRQDRKRVGDRGRSRSSRPPRQPAACQAPDS